MKREKNSGEPKTAKVTTKETRQIETNKWAEKMEAKTLFKMYRAEKFDTTKENVYDSSKWAALFVFLG